MIAGFWLHGKECGYDNLVLLFQRFITEALKVAESYELSASYSIIKLLSCFWI